MICNCNNPQPCPSAKKPYQVRLEGPWGLVLHRDPKNIDQITRITAFMPADDMGRHRFRVQQQDQSTSRTFSLALQQIQPPLNPPLCVGPGFCDFCVENTAPISTLPPKLITIEMSVPTSITIESSDTPLNVIFRSTKTGYMPRAYVLEYDLAVSLLQLVDTISGFNIPLPDDHLLLEVGLPKSDPDDASSSHALHFYNNHLLPFFGLEKNDDHVLATIFPSSALSIGAKRALATDPDNLTTTTTFECKAGGIIGGNP
jgi:hypothetical protein